MLGSRGGRMMNAVNFALFVPCVATFLTTRHVAAWAPPLVAHQLHSAAPWVSRPKAAPGSRAQLPLGAAWAQAGRGQVGGRVGLPRAANTRTEYDVEQLRLLDADECIVVDESDRVLGHGSKKFCHLMENIKAGKALHRAFSVFLFSTDGKLLLQKRSDDKILFPKRWTNTCCSHPLYNAEEMDDPATPDARGVRVAAVRKLEHELGIPVGAVPAESMHYMTRIVYKAAVGEDDKWGEHEVDYILLAVADVKCDINPNEVSEIRYVSKEELNELLAQEERQEIMLSPWFKAVAQRWLPMWWEALIAGKVDSVKDTEKIFVIGD